MDLNRSLGTLDAKDKDIARGSSASENSDLKKKMSSTRRSEVLFQKVQGDELFLLDTQENLDANLKGVCVRLPMKTQDGQSTVKGKKKKETTQIKYVT